MFVLQDCSICFEDFDAQRIPHSVSCGHVFCRPCLDSLVSSSPNCPNCRASFGRKTIRKVVCASQDSPMLDTSTLSEAEMIMWQTIESAVESVDEYEQRRSLIRDNSKLAVQKAGFSKNTLIALDMMRLLVEVESANRGADHNMDSARAIEESLRDRISFLEAQLSGTRASFSTNIRDFQTLLSKMQQLESSIRIPDETAPQTTVQTTISDPLPISANPHALSTNPIRTTSNPEQAPSPPQPKSMPPRNILLAESEFPRLPVLAAPAGSASPCSLTAARLSHQADTPRTRNPPELSSAGSGSANIQMQEKPASSQPQPPRTQANPAAEDAEGWSKVERRSKTWANLAAASSSRWGRAYMDTRYVPFYPRHQPSSSARTPTQRIITAVRSHTAKRDFELSLTVGETIERVYELDIFEDGNEWALCGARGEAGYVPRRCLSGMIGI